jgi:hypothetical protein
MLLCFFGSDQKYFSIKVLHLLFSLINNQREKYLILFVSEYESFSR